ncbi:glycoside hydrolase family 68 protein [Fructobacillus fructosus]|uniref:glycoside hydrolase family 68 protein n=1 Tax=Fructobacillus fructosus TaxID=1631 RepID=UPI0040332513
MENSASKHYKMYKSGKNWCLAAITLFVVMGVHSTIVSADNNDTNNNVVKAVSPNGTDNSSTNTAAINTTLTDTHSSNVQKTNNTADRSDTRVATIKDNIADQNENGTDSKQSENSKISTDADSSQKINFDDNSATTAYLMDGAKVYSGITGDNIAFNVQKDNVKVLRQGSVENGRVLVKIVDTQVKAYVNEVDLHTSESDQTPDNTSRHYTRNDFNSIIDSLNNSGVWAPKVETDSLNQSITSLVAHNNETGEDVSLPVWDSWPIQNPDGTVANYHGYRLVAGLTAEYGHPWWVSKIGLFAQKIGDDESISSWEYLGNAFNTDLEGRADSNDFLMDKMLGEWSGSAVLVNPDDDTIRLIYTNFSSEGQYLATAKLAITAKDNSDWNSGLYIDHSRTSDRKTIFGGDGQQYMKAQADGDIDQYAMRDPHIVYDNGQAYVVFQASTGTASGMAGENNLYNPAFYGMTNDEYRKELNYLLNQKGSDLYNRVLNDHGALGIIKLNSDFTVKKVEAPLVTFNGVADEVERANLFEYNDRWYLFGTTHSSHLANDNIVYRGQSGVAEYLIGFVSDNGILGDYKPLNGSGLVLVDDIGGANYRYSFLVIPNSDKNSNQFVVTSFVGGRSFAASFILEINGDTTRLINNQVLNQGALNPNGQRFDATPQSVYEFNGYLFDGSSQNGGYRWYEKNHLFTGFQYYMGAYYWFDNGVRQNNSFHEAWGKTYYTGADGRAVQGKQVVNGITLDFGDDDTYYLRSSGYLWDGSAENGGYRWYENGELFSGFRYYAGTYYWFVNGVRQNAGWRQAWGYTYYTDEDGRALQGSHFIDGKLYNFGEDGTYYSRPLTGYLWDGSAENGGYRWYENGELYTGFRYYTGTYYWFIDGVRQNAGWREAWGYKYYTDGDGRAVQGWQKIDGVDYYFGDDNTFYLR